MGEIGSSNPLDRWPKPLSFVLAGGGSYGATQVGMIRALIESGIVPDLVIGTSVGALNGARLAHDPATAAEALTQAWRRIDRRTIFGSNTKYGAGLQMVRTVLRPNAVATCSPDRLTQLIDDYDMPEKIEELPITTGVVVTDMLVGTPKVLRSGPLTQALLASAAIPGVFPPVQIEGCIYVDGGVAANVPIRPAMAAGAKSMVVLDCGPSGLPNRVPSNLVEMGAHTSVIMQRNQVAGSTSGLSSQFPILQLPQTTPSDLNPFDFKRSDELIERSYTATRKFLDSLPELTDTSRHI